MQWIGNLLLSLRNVKIRGENIVVFRAGGGRWSVGSGWVVYATSTKSGCPKGPERLVVCQVLIYGLNGSEF